MGQTSKGQWLFILFHFSAFDELMTGYVDIASQLCMRKVKRGVTSEGVR